MTDNDALIQRFLDYCAVERGLQPLTIEAYNRDLERFTSVCSGSLLDATHEDVQRCLDNAEADGCGPRSRGRYISCLRSFFRFLQLDGLTKRDPMLRIDRPKQWRILPRVFSHKEVMRLLEGSTRYKSRLGPAAELRDRAICELAYSCGLRASELISLRLANLHHDRVLVHGKGDKERIVPLAAPAAWALIAYMTEGRGHFRHAQDSPFVFLSQRYGQMSRQAVWLLVQRRAKRAKLEKFHPHSFRHACATHMLEGGADLRTLQEILGHADISTTEIYTHVSLSYVRRVYLKAHPRGERLAELQRLEHRREYLRGWQAEHRAESKAQAVCIECAAPVAPGSKSHCAKHLEMVRQSVARHAARRMAEGRCRNCKKPVEAPSRYFCAYHREQHNARTREYMRRRRLLKQAQKAAAAA